MRFLPLFPAALFVCASLTPAALAQSEFNGKDPGDIVETCIYAEDNDHGLKACSYLIDSGKQPKEYRHFRERPLLS